MENAKHGAQTFQKNTLTLISKVLGQIRKKKLLQESNTKMYIEKNSKIT